MMEVFFMKRILCCISLTLAIAFIFCMPCHAESFAQAGYIDICYPASGKVTPVPLSKAEVVSEFSSTILSNAISSLLNAEGLTTDEKACINNAYLSEPFLIPIVYTDGTIEYDNTIWYYAVLDETRVYAYFPVFKIEGTLKFCVTNYFVSAINDIIAMSGSAELKLFYPSDCVNSTDLYCQDSSGHIYNLNSNSDVSIYDNVDLSSELASLGISPQIALTSQNRTIKLSSVQSTRAVVTRTLNNYPAVLMTGSLACWDASILSMIRYELPDYSSLTSLFNSYPVGTGTWVDIMNAFYYYFGPYGYNPTHAYGTLNRASVMSHIENNDPIFMQSYCSQLASSHATVICGYQDNLSANTFSLYIMNPAYTNPADNPFYYSSAADWNSSYFYYVSGGYIYVWQDSVYFNY